MSENETVIDFPGARELSEEQRAKKIQRIVREARRLASLSPGEWKLWICRSAETFDVPRAMLEELVVANIQEMKEKKRADEAERLRIEERAEKQRIAVEREQKRAHEREQQRIDKEAALKSNEKHKTFGAIIKLPRDQHEGKVVELANRLDEDLAALRGEFAEFCATESPVTASSEWHVEPWDEPVATAALLQQIVDKISQHIVMRSHQVLAARSGWR